jgi:pimeloyl-ACP methyl ester carboxylesterase
MAASMAPLSPPGRLIDVGGFRLHLHEMGQGTPVVVFEAAIGGSALTWSLVQPHVSHVTRTCSYDRGGFGWSEPGPQPRTAGRVADELRVLLRRAGINPPFVFVGHSFGGLVGRIFARRHQSEMAGLVLVDPAHPEDWVTPAPKEQIKIDRALVMCRVGARASRLGITRLVSALPGVGASGLARTALALIRRGRVSSEDAGILAPVWNLPLEGRRQLGVLWSRGAFFDALASHLRSMPESSGEVLEAAAEGYGDLPLVTISATDPGDYRLRQQEALARLSTRGRHLIAPNSGHWIPLEEPHVVVEAVRTVIEMSGS